MYQQGNKAIIMQSVYQQGNKATWQAVKKEPHRGLLPELDVCIDLALRNHLITKRRVVLVDSSSTTSDSTEQHDANLAKRPLQLLLRHGGAGHLQRGAEAKGSH